MIDVEKEFDHCVKKISGIKISDIVGYSPCFLNADYMFNEYSVIAELKCLEEDKIKSDSIKKKASELYLKYLENGTAPVVVFGTVKISTEGFPDEFRKEIAELYRVPIHNVIKKANQQIRETKENLKMNDFHGLLIIANNGHKALEPSLAMWLFYETFRRYSFSSIDSVIYFTVNLKAEHPDMEDDILVWMPTHRSPENMCPDQLQSRLQKTWHKHVENLFGIPIKEINISNPDFIEKISNI